MLLLTFMPGKSTEDPRDLVLESRRVTRVKDVLLVAGSAYASARCPAVPIVPDRAWFKNNDVLRVAVRTMDVPCWGRFSVARLRMAGLGVG
jgi:hypothetical protein